MQMPFEMGLLYHSHSDADNAELGRQWISVVG